MYSFVSFSLVHFNNQWNTYRDKMTPVQAFPSMDLMMPRMAWTDQTVYSLTEGSIQLLALSNKVHIASNLPL